jgi:small neutral amino acid transporter SnatA (MarC family)
MGLSMRFEAWTIEPHFVVIMVAYAVGQFVITSFHLSTGQLQVLAGIIVDVL